MHDSSAFEYYEDKGRVDEGHRMLLRLGSRRFGTPDAATETALRAVEDLDRIERMADVILTATSWQELLTAP